MCVFLINSIEGFDHLYLCWYNMIHVAVTNSKRKMYNM